MFETRQDYNKKLINEVLMPIVEKNPDLRFCQIICVLGMDVCDFNEESSVTYQKLYEAYLEKFEKQIVCEKKNKIREQLMVAKQMLDKSSKNKEVNTMTDKQLILKISDNLSSLANNLAMLTQNT